MHHVFNGTLPVRPYHPTLFFGTIKADGQLPKVGALACYHQEVVAISLVGYDTSVSAALARLWQREQLTFEPDPAIDWHGPVQLCRRQENYKQFHTTLPGTKEVHILALPNSANIAEGMLHPPDIPKPKDEQTSSSCTAMKSPTWFRSGLLNCGEMAWYGILLRHSRRWVSKHGK